MTPDSLERQPTSREEIAAIIGRYRVAISDAGVSGQSADGRYVHAYTAGFLLAKLVVRVAGYRVKGGENHRDTLRAVPWLMGMEAQGSVDALDAARKRRNMSLYDEADMVDEGDVRALLARVKTFESAVFAWMADRHPDLLG